VLFGIFAEVDVSGHRLDGVAAFAFTLAINGVYLGVVWMITSFGIDHLASWAAAEARANVANVVAGIARGLPLLLIVTAFSVLSADVWEAVARMRLGAYLALIALILAAAVTFAALSAKRELDKDRAAFETWRAVRLEIAPRLSTPRRATKPPDFGPELDEALRVAAPSDASLHSKLGIRRWLNLIGVLAVYQAFIFVPLMIAGAAVFWVIGRLAVRASVAGAWIYGDGSSTTLANALTTRPFFEQPWTRIAVLLGAFSSLYAVVQVLSTKEQRTDFFRGADEALRLRFAVLMAYDAVFATEDDSARPREDVAASQNGDRPGQPSAVERARPSPTPERSERIRASGG